MWAGALRWSCSWQGREGVGSGGVRVELPLMPVCGEMLSGSPPPLKFINPISLFIVTAEDVERQAAGESRNVENV